ncbi:flagellar motor stator protein MotA [Permianibacter aggregans]|uniref:Chemotaxis protein MotA n=1 Tax=Permianibacter aggregans TaxID=1510150 RepID=A0A4V3D7V9_9GAMM|nr:flagellar motor stator protein MotA [Permianibacter aggregans]QGX40516.1 flagellar motor stator protein MotA [Permianibacter aggregans]TDQ49337.1 chemotaxis protein MotA [Permianibacter aggregans]
MNLIVGAVIVWAAVIAGYMLSGGDLLALWQPFELITICGAAFGAFFIANPMGVIAQTFKGGIGLLGGSPYNKTMYMELLSLLYDLFSKIRKEGLIAIEGEIEDPKASAIFTKYKLIMKDHHVLDFICDYMRLMVVGDMSAHELEALMDAEMEAHHTEALLPANALQKVADALPGFGIVAAVMGIVITMGALGGPPEVLGHHVAAALVGTFLGILFAYGFVAPMVSSMEHKVREEGQFYACIKASLLACVSGAPPQVAIEFGRKVLFSSVRPSFTELEKRVRGN